ncbi:hypothetical protein SODG_006104 [Sodalis praecaptivus]|nr:hypothetical protein NVIRENTERO_01807 [Sodalis praecaptivus]
MPVESPALQNHRVGMFNNKTYRYKRKSDNIMPCVNPAAIDGNPLGEQIERLIHTRNDTPSINQTFNSNNSSMLNKVITLYALLTTLKYQIRPNLRYRTAVITPIFCHHRRLPN